MLVIVEGVDGSGKTTLIKQLEARGFKSSEELAPGKPNDYDMDVVQEWYTLSSSNRDKIRLVDRSFISEIVYSTVLNRRTNLDLKDWINYLDHENIKIIFCWNDFAYSKAKERGENYITDEETHEKLSEMYHNVMSLIKKFTNAKVFAYNYDVHSIDIVQKFILGD